MNIVFGAKSVKRILSVLISVILLFTSLSAGLSAVAQAIPRTTNLERFADKLTDMIRKYDNQGQAVSENSTLLDEVASYFPIVYAEQYYSAVVNNATENDAEGERKSATDFGLPENAFDLNRLIVKAENNIDYHGAIDCVNGYNNLYVLQYSSLEDTIDAYEYYLTVDSIEYVEPDIIYNTQLAEYEEASSDDIEVEPDDYVEIFEKIPSWSTEAVGFDVIKQKLSEIKLKDVVVAVLDSGVDTDHEIFEGRLEECFVNCSDTGAENSIEDDFGHGTHVAGIIADNTLKNVKIKPYKVLNREGKGSLSSIVTAIDLAVESGVDIINMSLTADGESQAMTDSVNAAVDKGINVVVAAGNRNVDLNIKKYTPACIESAITVSAVTKEHTLSSYSNYNGPIDIAAPGDDIISAYLNNTYVSMDGTSMAAPQVAAALAVVRSFYVEKTNYELEEFVEKYATHIEEAEGSNKFGAGILNIKNILEDRPQSVEPTFNVESGEFVNSFDLTIKSYEKDAVVYYIAVEREISNSDDSSIFDFNILEAKKYEKAIRVSVDTVVAAVAKAGDKKISSVVVMKYDRKNTCEEDLYDINSSGMITGYVGTATELVIPEKIQGKTVKGIASYAFKDNTDIHSVVLPSTAISIGVDAFRNCTNLESVTGGSVTSVNLNAFYNSGISEFSFEKLRSVSDKAFYGCKNLKNAYLSNVEKIGVSAFENSGITEVSNEKLTMLGNYAFKGSSVTAVNLPKLTTLGSGVFEKCSDLVSVSMPLLTEVPANTFKNCTSLVKADMPAVTSIGNSAFYGTSLETVCFENVEEVGTYAFREAKMKYAFLPSATKIGTGCFWQCENLKFVYVPTLKVVEANTFYKCNLLKSVWLPAVEIVNKNAFKNCSVEYVQLDNVQTVESLPVSLLGIVLPSTLTSITAIIPETDFKVYGYENTFAQQFAAENSKEFLEVPAMICETPENVSIDEQYIYTYALGFNCTYQWYKNDTVSNENGTLLEGANHYWYEPSKDDDAVCYYCVITSNDGVNYSEAVTEPIANIPEYRCADFTDYNYAVQEAEQLDRELYTDASLLVLDALLAINISGYSLAEQDLVAQHVQAIKNAISSLAFDFVSGDVNDDGKISLLDARLALKAVSGTAELGKLQTLSADMNDDGKISLIDVRAILRIVSEMSETE